MSGWVLRDDKVGNSRLSKPVAVMMARLHAQSKAGGILEGIKVANFPVHKLEGADDLPTIFPMEYTDMDISHGGGAKTGIDKTSNNIVQPECTITFMLCVARDSGIYTDKAPWGIINWVERVKDSLEVSSDGSEDLMLNYSCMKPMYVHTREQEITELAWSVLLEVEYYPLPIQRGTRHYVWHYNS